jgi:hypothetical protein
MDTRNNVLYHRKISRTIEKAKWDQPASIKLDFPMLYETDFKARLIFEECLKEGEEGGRLVMIYFDPQEIITSQPLCVELSFVFKSNDEDISPIIVKNGKGSEKMKIKTFINKDGTKSITKNTRTFSIYPEKLFDEYGQFVFEAEVSVRVDESIDDFATNISSIIDDEESSDVTIESENMEYKCHKIILKARSPVFKSMLVSEHSFLESKTNTVKLKNYSDDAVKNMIIHIYSGSIPEEPTVMSEELLTLADMYQLGKLKEACIGNMINCLKVKNCISAFIMIDRILPVEAPERKSVISFMVCKVLEVVDSENWSKLVTSFPELVTELIREMGERSRKDVIHVCQFCVIGRFGGFNDPQFENGDF